MDFVSKTIALIQMLQIVLNIEAAINWQKGNRAVQCDFPNLDFTNKNNVPVSVCSSLCTNTTGCTHYTWTNYNGGTCWMKYGIVSLNDALRTSDPTVACGIVGQTLQPTKTISWQPDGWAMQCDFPNLDFQNKTNVLSAQCGGLCTNTVGCTHFTWTNANNGTCWMKNGLVSQSNAFITTDPTVVCGIVRQPKLETKVVDWQPGNWAMQCDFSSLSFKNKTNVPGSQCGGLCWSTTGCTNFKWTSNNNGTCWLKNGSISYTDAFVTSDPTMVCGLVGQQTTVPAKTINWQFGGWARQCDFSKFYFKNKTATPSSQCGGVCVNTPGCTHFTWTNSNNGTCWMKNGLVSQSDAFITSDSSMVCGIVGQTSNASTKTLIWQTGSTAVQCDFPNPDFQNKKNVSSAQCGGLCKNTVNCTHYTWTNANNGTCWMKNGLVSQSDAYITSDPSMVCGVVGKLVSSAKKITWQPGNWAMQCDFPNLNFQSKINVPGSQCGGLCWNTPGCSHFTWTTSNNGTCWMKNGTISLNEAFVSSDPTTVCGTAAQPTTSAKTISWQPGGFAQQCDFPNLDLQNKVKVPGSQCSGLCRSTTGCTHYTWTNSNNGTCWLKTGSVSQNDARITSDPTVVCGVIDSRSRGVPGALVFSDEFDYSGAPDAKKWLQQQGGHGWGNNELQFYTDKNAYVANGVLTIETRKENFGNRSYTSARLLSKTAFKYGIFEMRAKLPQGRGSWPAFWLLNNTKWPDTGEIDILEHVGYDPGVIHANIHCKKYNHVIGTNKGNSITLSNPFNEWYTYKLDWNAERMIFYVDNIEFFVYSNTEKTYEAWPFDLSETIIINTAVGGTWGGANGVDDSIFPMKFVTYLID